MKHSILTAIILVYSIFSYGQTYERLYTDNLGYTTLSGGLVAGAYGNNTAFFLNRSLNIADSTGTIIVSTPISIYPSAMLQTADGGYVFASKATLGYASLTKSDSVGNILWQVNLPPDTTALIYQMRIDSAGNTYILADSGTNRTIQFLQKYDVNGNLLWSKETNDVECFNLTEANNIILAAQASSYNIFTEELDFNGDSLWQQNFTYSNRIYPGDITVLSSGNIVALCVNYSQTYYTAKLYQLDPSGALLDSMALPGSFLSSSVFKLRNSADGSLLVYASAASSGIAAQASLIDISTFGQVNWQRSFLNDGNNETAYDIYPLPHGIIISGDSAHAYYRSGGQYQYNSAVFIARLDMTGQYYTPAIADTSFNLYSAYEAIDTNNIFADFINNGNLFEPLGLVAPKADTQGADLPRVILFGSIWAAGKSNGQLYNSSEALLGSAYQAGPVGTLPQDAGVWNNIWLIRRSDVLSVKNDFDSNHMITRPVPADVLSWPAKGNTQATGNGGLPLSVNQDMAPFYDRNGDGIYNVYDGDYPMMRGDQMLWWINNDWGSSSQNAMDIDRRYSVYEYDCQSDSNLNNSLFLSVTLRNQSSRAYDSVSLGTYFFTPLGCANNDRIGSIPGENSFYCYKGYVGSGTQQNGVTCDEGSVCPTSEVGYGCSLPIISATFLNDSMRAFMYYTNGSVQGEGDPSSDQQYYQNMNAQWADGTPLTYGGNGYGGTTPASYAYPGNPADTTQWSECNPQTGPVLPAGDRRCMGSIGPFSLGIGDTISFDMAFIFHPDSFNNTPDISDSSIVEHHIDSIRRYYASETFPCWFDSSKLLSLIYRNVGIKTVAFNPAFSLVPNPNNGSFTIHVADNAVSSYAVTVTDMLGSVIYYNAYAQAPDQVVQMGNAASGVYAVTIETPNYSLTKKMVLSKQ